jgi:methionine sulfoxide reductase heme-binding subunit
VKNDPTFWIIARAAGLTAYVLLTTSVMAGIVVKARPFGRALRVATAVDLHRTLALLTLGALALHGTALVLDKTVNIGFGALFVPGLAPYRPIWTGLGVVASELMVIVYASFSLRSRIGQRAWRKLHWATYGLFAAATAHGVMAGSDSGRGWAVALYLGAVGAVAFAAAWRALVPAGAPRPRPLPQNSEGAS